jgi:hypothetical protein
MIQSALLFGSLGDAYTIMDATAAASLPDGVIGTRVPSWMLPSVPSQDLALLRPDLLIIEGLSTTAAAALGGRLQDPSVLAHIQSRCRIHLIELGYTSESLHSQSVHRKQDQHSQLLLALAHAGWTVVPGFHGSPYHVLMLGITGVIFRPFTDVLNLLGLRPDAITTLLRDLHVHSVRFVSSLVRLRRRIEASGHLQFEPP